MWRPPDKRTPCGKDQFCSVNCGMVWSYLHRVTTSLSLELILSVFLTQKSLPPISHAMWKLSEYEIFHSHRDASYDKPRLCHPNYCGGPPRKGLLTLPQAYGWGRLIFRE